ncbi:MAG: DEAD/DEAH box helicase [Acidimicrobiales bacterium]
MDNANLAAPEPASESTAPALDSDETPAGQTQLQASWSGGELVVWAGGPGVEPLSHDELSDLLEASGGPAHGWNLHESVVLPGAARAAALSIAVADALGWLIAVAGAADRDRVGASVRWFGHLAVYAVRMVAQGRAVPTLPARRRAGGTATDIAVRWVPALLEDREVAALAALMPGAAMAAEAGDARKMTRLALGAVVHAVATEGTRRLDLPAAPPRTRSTVDVEEAFISRLDGSSFRAPVPVATDVSKRVQRWARPVTGPSRTKLVVQVAPPDEFDSWLLVVLVASGDGELVPIAAAMADSKASDPVAAELARLERVLPLLRRSDTGRRGQVFLTPAEAWELMTEQGPSLQAAGFEMRVPAMSRRRPAPGLRLFAEPAGETTVGAQQLSNVRWSAVVGDVELSAAEIARLARQARPLVQTRGRWVELDQADLKAVEEALAERASMTTLTGAEILRHAVGLAGDAQLAGGLSVEGEGWATELLERSRGAPAEAVTEPEGFRGTLRHYQAEALGWLRFLDAVDLGGCLALDMGLGKTPTVLAHVAATAGDGAALVIAPPAVVGNWAAEAARFTPGMRVVIHHGAARAEAEALDAEVAGADIVITTYGTAVRDIDALAGRTWERVVLDEAQAIKNPASETAQQLRRIPARSRLALTGTPIENSLGDLWSILDYTNPGLVGPRPTFVAQLAGEGEAALHALNGLLVFRRTKSEPDVAAELPDRIDELDHCTMTREQIGLYQAVLDDLVAGTSEDVSRQQKKGAVLAAITALKQICNHPTAYQDDDRPLAGRSGKLARLEEIVEAVFAADERLLVFTHFAAWGRRLADYLTQTTGVPIDCYHGGLARGARDRLVTSFQQGGGPGALVLSLKAGGTGLNLTAASHVVLYDRWWNPAVEDQARDRAWRIGQTRTVVCHRLVCPGTVDERVEEVVAGKRHIADLVLPKSSTLSDLDSEQLRAALGLHPDTLLTEESL